MAEYSICKGCGARIVWAVTEDGKKIPVDPKPPVYKLFWAHPHPITKAPVAAWRVAAVDLQGSDPEGYGVNHFATCPKAIQFSSKEGK